MIQNLLRNLGGIEAIGLVSLILFVACFLGVLLWAFGLKKNHLDAMSRLPLDRDTAVEADAAERLQLLSRHE